MEEKTLNISKELLDNLSIEELADLKIEVDDIVNEISNIKEICDEALNS